MRKLLMPAALALALGSALGQAAPAHAQAVRYLAANCANCHGTDGRSTEGMPKLAGVSVEQFMSMMKGFRDGTRQATIMHQLSKGYSDEQLAALARYFSQQK